LERLFEQETEWSAHIGQYGGGVGGRTTVIHIKGLETRLKSVMFVILGLKGQLNFFSGISSNFQYIIENYSVNKRENFRIFLFLFLFF
jgi:hypothetical protein